MSAVQNVARVLAGVLIVSNNALRHLLDLMAVKLHAQFSVEDAIKAKKTNCR